MHNLYINLFFRILSCSIPKLFRYVESPDSTMVKLNKNKIKEIIDKKKCGFSTKYIATKLEITQRRVQQIYKQYLGNNTMPQLKKNRRPKTFLTAEQKALIEMLYLKHKVSPKLLKIALEDEYPSEHIAKNKIYEYYKEKGYSKPDKKKQEKRKRTRYERKHSGSLGHMDTHNCKWNRGMKLVTLLDDASRKIFAAHEGSNSNTQTSILVVKEGMQEAWKYMVLINAINTDRGTEFFAAKKGKKHKVEHGFVGFLKTQSIRHIPSGLKNPQTNGKLERFHQEYEKHRPSFSSLKEFIDWYNNRIHGELRTTPNKAFLRKLRPESLLGLCFREDFNEAKK